MARKGASGMVVVKMMGNILLDAIVGAIPLLGDIFDLAFRANRRNLHLLQAIIPLANTREVPGRLSF